MAISDRIIQRPRISSHIISQIEHDLKAVVRYANEGKEAGHGYAIDDALACLQSVRKTLEQFSPSV